MIPQDFIDQVQQRTDIVDLVGSYIPLKRAGRNFKACCPFHQEKTASFMVSPQKQIFHCFGCGEGGAALQFIMKIEKVSFVEAVEIAARRLAMTVPAQQSAQAQKKTALYDAVQQAAQFFHNNLIQHKQGKIVQKYLEQRGIGAQTIKQFQIGLSLRAAPVLDYLRDKQFALEQLQRASLIIPGRDGFRDLFWDRVMFPICDVRGRPIGFGARLWKDRADAPKYINSLENSLYSKRHHLFGLHLAKEAISKEDCVIVVEGYLDMITPFMRGVKNIVASLGTALTEQQIRLLKRYTNNVVLVYDSDSAGQNAALRALDVLLEQGVVPRVVSLPQGKDPDSLVRTQGVEAFTALLSKREDFFDFKFSLVSREHDSGTAQGKSSIAQEMFSTLDKLQDGIQRHEYLKKLARILSVQESVLLSEYKRRNHTGDRRAGVPQASRDSSQDFEQFLQNYKRLSLTEKILLKYMFSQVKAFGLVRKHLRPQDFSLPLAQKIITHFYQRFPEGQEPEAHFTAATQDDQINRFVTHLMLDDTIAVDKGLFKSSFKKLCLNRIKKIREQVKEEICQAEQQGDQQRLRRLLGKYERMRSFK